MDPRSVRQRVLEFASSTALQGLSYAGRAVLPNAKPHRYGVVLHRDVAYGPRPRNLLDVYVPAGEGPFPVVLYLHGGAFRMLSKETHWMMAREYALRGFVVYVPNYRLVPQNPFPAAIEDACDAYLFMLESARRYGGDPSRRIVSGESAGGNLSLVLALASCVPSVAMFARRVFEADAVPTAALPLCGVYQVSNSGRFGARRKIPLWIDDSLTSIEDGYLANGLGGLDAWLADPLLFLESDQATARALPPVFTSIGTRDPLLDDTRRLERALRARGVQVEATIYPGEIHAFQALAAIGGARDHWRRSFDFIEGAGIPCRRPPTNERRRPRVRYEPVRRHDSKNTAAK